MYKKLTVVYALLFITLNGNCIDTLRHNVSLFYYTDLSDTYDGGNLFSGEVCLLKDWYGLSFSYGFFQSKSIFKYVANVEEVNKSIEILFDEISIMKLGSINLLMEPVKFKNFSTRISFGLSLARAKSLQFHDVEFSYSYVLNKFTYLYKNYELVEKKHFGYQFGLDAYYFILKKAGIQLSSRIQHLNNGGSFFFVGGGLCFRF